MRVGVGLPTTTPGADRDLLLEWARRADEGPFASLGLLDRVKYESFEPFASLGAAAAVTERVELVTMIVIGPLRNSVLLAKQAATVDRISQGRLTLGLAVGARRDDYELTGVEYRTRGARLTEQLETIRSVWEDGAVGPAIVRFAEEGDRFSGGTPRILAGGASGSAFSRMARYADGYVHGGGPPRAFAGAASRALAAWTDAERPGRPLLYGQGYFALGDDAALDGGSSYLLDYYAFTGPFAEKIAAANLTTPTAIAEFVRGYEEAGCDELVLLPTVADLSQLERLADVLS
jgi:alkanesulfonate monooxygenase SsuD/methylene tetrahydromethanopterin reductase-like flavin-dependent oxidoreductase (luciferase family)